MLIFYYHNESDLQTVIISAGGASQTSDGGGIFTIHQNGLASRDGYYSGRTFCILSWAGHGRPHNSEQFSPAKIRKNNGFIFTFYFVS